MSLRKRVATLVAVTMPLALFSVNATQSRAQSQVENTTSVAPLYKTVSIKPNKSGIHWDTIKTGPDELTVKNGTLRMLIRDAYKVEDDQIVGAPTWLNSEHYDIEAKVENSAADEPRKINLEQGQQENDRMLQLLLFGRFKLAVHRERKQIPVYELVIAGDGPKLQESAPAYSDSAPRVIQVESGRITGREVPIATLARILSEQLGRPVLDQTGLRGHYDVAVQWPTNPNASDPATLTAIQDQLGLKLEPQQMSKEFLVIDHVEPPRAD